MSCQRPATAAARRHKSWREVSIRKLGLFLCVAGTKALVIGEIEGVGKREGLFWLLADQCVLQTHNTSARTVGGDGRT